MEAKITNRAELCRLASKADKTAYRTAVKTNKRIKFEAHESERKASKK